MTRSVTLFIAVPALLGALVVACGPGKTAENAPAQTCRVTLAPRTGPLEPAPLPPGAAFSALRSTLVVHAEVPLSMVQKNLEAKVARRVADVKDQDIGMAGRLEYTADRGAFTVAVQGDTLAVDTPVVVHARACAKNNCYASCDPEAHVTARVPLRLGADYKFRQPSVTVAITKGCEVKALGGFARIDVTPMLQQRLDQEKPRLEAEIRNQLPDLKPESERIWNDLSHPRPLALGSCLILHPEAVTQGAPAGTPSAARLSFGLLAYPELRTRCGDVPATKAMPLPALRDDPNLPADGDVHLSIVMPPETIAASFEGAQDVIDLGAGKSHLQHVTGATGGNAQGLAIDLYGEVCGPVGVRAFGAAWTDDGRAVHLVQTSLPAADPPRLTAAGLDPNAFMKSIEKVPIPIPIAPDQLKSTIPELAKSESDQTVDVSVQIADAHPESAGLRGAGDVIAIVELKGSATIRAK